MPPLAISMEWMCLWQKVWTEDEEIAFNAGSHRELVKMAYKDFERLVKPKGNEIFC